MGIFTTITGLASARNNPTLPSNEANGIPGWRPPIWGAASSDPTGSKARYCLVYQDILSNQTTDAGVTARSDENVPGGYVIRKSQVSVPTTVYNVFDAILAGRFDSNLRITDYPVQSGQIFSYNAVLEPLRISLEIGMSDTMQSYIPNTFTGNGSRSVAAFQLLQYLQDNRIFCTLNTRWGNFPNTLIENLSLLDNNQTYASARFSVTFRQVQISTVANITLSTRPQSTQLVNGGTSNSQNVPQTVVDTNQIQPTTPISGNDSIASATNNGNLVTVAAGNYSSNPIADGVD